MAVAAWGGVPVPAGVGQSQDVSDAEQWLRVEKGLGEVWECGSSEVSFDGIYRVVVRLVEGGKGPWLYEKLNALTKEAVLVVEQKVLATPRDDIAALTGHWEQLDSYLKKVRTTTSYLECQWVLRNGLPTILDASRTIAVQYLLKGTFLGEVLVQHVVEAAAFHNMSSDAAHESEKRVVQLFSVLTEEHYSEIFASVLLESYRVQLEAHRDEALQEPDVGRFVARIDEMIASVVKWSASFSLPPKTLAEIEAFAESVYFTNLRVEEKLVAQTTDILAERNTAPLRTVLTRATAHPPLAEATFAKLLDILRTDSTEKSLPIPTTTHEGMEAITAFHIFCQEIQALYPSKPEVEQLVEAEKYVVHEREAMVIPVLSKYLDSSLKTGDVDPAVAWGRVVPLYQILAQRDLFEEMCRKRLSARLLSHKGCNVSDEQTVVACLRKEYEVGQAGLASAVRRMEEMLKDAAVSEGETKEFGGREGTAFMVLNTAAWPSFNKTYLAIPGGLWDTLSAFEEHYAERHTGRVLTWLHSVSHVTLAAALDKKHEISCGFVDGVVLLMCFNEATAKTLKAITSELLTEASTDVCGNELKQALVRLVGAKVLLCGDKVVGDATEYKLNMAIKQRKINVIKRNVDAPQKQGEADSNAEHLLERKSLTEATIVRIMKTKHTVEYQELIAETIAQLSARFKPDIALIKKRLDDLLARGYVARDDNDRNTFNYVS